MSDMAWVIALLVVQTVLLVLIFLSLQYVGHLLELNLRLIKEYLRLT